MGFHSIAGSDIRYGLVAFDESGRERLEGTAKFTDTLIAEAAQAVTNVFFFNHGWQGDIPAAIQQYDKWIGALMRSSDVARAPQVFAGFRPLLVGLHWPSLPWGKEDPGNDGSFSVADRMGPDALFDDFLMRLGGRVAIRGPLEIIFNEARRNMTPDSLPPAVRRAYLDLNDALGLGSQGVSAPPDADRGDFDPDQAFQAGNDEGADFADLDLGGILGPLRQLSYWNMKKRARTVGEGGMHQFLRDLQTATAAQGTRIHLMGHSFGTIVVSGMLGGPNASAPLVRPVDSVALVQGAVSLWCYAAAIPFPNSGPGYFHRLVLDGKVAGPLITTQSRFDNAVGRFYPLASRLGGSAAFAAALPEFGAVGAYGLQGLGESTQSDISMLAQSGHYDFQRGRVYNLEASQFICHGSGASGAHSDIAGPEVAHALWEAAFASAH